MTDGTYFHESRRAVDPVGDDDLLSDVEVAALLAPLRSGPVGPVPRWSMTLEQHRHIEANRGRPVTDDRPAALAQPGQVIVPHRSPSARDLHRQSQREYRDRKGL